MRLSAKGMQQSKLRRARAARVAALLPAVCAAARAVRALRNSVEKLKSVWTSGQLREARLVDRGAHL